jgi:hypothetical protein
MPLMKCPACGRVSIRAASCPKCGHSVPEIGERNSFDRKPSKEEIIAAAKRTIAENPNPSMEQIFAGLSRGIAESERAGRPFSRKVRVLLFMIPVVLVIWPIAAAIWRITRALTGR